MDRPQPRDLLRPGRRITGVSAVLLPFDGAGRVDWDGFAGHIARTAGAGLAPAVNLDTGYGPLLDDPTRREALDRARSTIGRDSPWYAGAIVDDDRGDPFAPDRHRRAMDEITERGGTPVVFPSYGLAALSDAGRVDALAALGPDPFVAFELGRMFAPQGFLLSLDAFRALLDVPACVGAKHSSLRREPEWARLALRDAHRPDFAVFSGNDLAIDMVMYGSDYLLGLSTLAPDEFAQRDARWAACDPAFFDLNDALQALGSFAFRAPVPAYKHDAAMVLALRGWIGADHPPPGAPTRPASDREVLAALLDRLGEVAA